MSTTGFAKLEECPLDGISYLPHPDCNRYIIRLNGEETEEECQRYFYYNPRTEHRDFPENVPECVGGTRTPANGTTIGLSSTTLETPLQPEEPSTTESPPPITVWDESGHFDSINVDTIVGTVFRLQFESSGMETTKIPGIPLIINNQTDYPIIFPLNPNAVGVAEWDPIVITSGAKFVTEPGALLEHEIIDEFPNPNCSSWFNVTGYRLQVGGWRNHTVYEPALWNGREKGSKNVYHKRAFYCCVFQE
ncbi:hypothetical protein Ocin01_18219 [Orchesella cincta]|uniref:Chitin-binding type-2 domain-containing protein n=1 Tax=Orchesella cincta TaxID=48709 RepID=A0A1D2M674_ORCCI|nr:hypothetical protein Ocin01_18219 [Orchesella cincta]